MAEYKYTTCRSFGHTWAVVEIGKSRNSKMGSEIHLICGNCGMLRVDVVSRTSGMLLYRTYTKPDNYTTERTSKDEWRKQYLRSAQNQSRARQRSRDQMRS